MFCNLLWLPFNSVPSAKRQTGFDSHAKRRWLREFCDGFVVLTEQMGAFFRGVQFPEIPTFRKNKVFSGPRRKPRKKSAFHLLLLHSATFCYVLAWFTLRHWESRLCFSKNLCPVSAPLALASRFGPEDGSDISPRSVSFLRVTAHYNLEVASFQFITLPRDWVTIDGTWIGNRIHWTLDYI
jgi:hypothetical protein